MRFTFFLAHMGEGGAERVMVTLANAFARRNLVPTVVLAQAEGPLLKELLEDIPVVDLRAGHMRLVLPRLTSYLRRHRPEVLLSTLSQPNLVALLARRWSQTSTRIVVREANTPTLEFGEASSWKDRIVPQLIGLLYPQADAVVAVSHGVASALQQLGVPKPVVIYNPVITPQMLTLSHEPEVHAWFHGDEPVVLGVGRLEPQKDFATLIRAFAQVVRVRPARLLIWGEGSQRPVLQQLIQSLGIGDRVALPGYVSNPFASMRRAAVFVLSSRFEGLPNVLIQAMACGCPVVSTDCPSGPAEILDGGRYGHLVPVGDVEALAAAILEVLAGGGKSVPSEWLQQFEESHGVAQYLQVLTGERYRAPAGKQDSPTNL